MQRAPGALQPGPNRCCLVRDHRSQESYREFRRDRNEPVREEAVCHGAIEQRGDDTSVQGVGIPLEKIGTVEVRLDAAIGHDSEVQTESSSIPGTAHDTAAVDLLPHGGQRLLKRSPLCVGRHRSPSFPTCRPIRLLKKAHLLRWRARAALRRTD